MTGFEAALQMAAFLFLVSLPLTMVIWVVLFVAAGLVRDASAMPGEFRIVYQFAFPEGPDSPAVHAIGPAAMLLLFNVPIFITLSGRYGILVVLEAVAYLLAEALWVRRFWRASR